MNGDRSMAELLRIRTISFYDRFSCLGGSCPQTCCHGWRIPVDEAQIRRYRRERGLLGLRLRLALPKGAEPAFRPLFFHCPMHGADGLCRLQKERGAGFLPEVCRIFPREWANLGYFVERTLDLSCVRAAELFLESEGEEDGGLSFREELGPWDRPRAGDNEDRELLEVLERKRGAYLERLSVWSPQALDEALFQLAEDALGLQERYLRVAGGRLRRIRLFPFSIMLWNELMSTCFFEPHLRWTAPRLYRLCRRYYRRFDHLTEIQGQERMDALCASFFAGEEGRARARGFAGYAAYCLLRSWYDAYEDYSFLRRIQEAAIHANMVLLLELLAYGAGEALDLRQRAMVIASYEKRVWHNNDVADAMVRVMDKRIA